MSSKNNTKNNIPAQTGEHSSFPAGSTSYNEPSSFTNGHGQRTKRESVPTPGRNPRQQTFTPTSKPAFQSTFSPSQMNLKARPSEPTPHFQATYQPQSQQKSLSASVGTLDRTQRAPKQTPQNLAPLPEQQPISDKKMTPRQGLSHISNQALPSTGGGALSSPPTSGANAGSSEFQSNIEFDDLSGMDWDLVDMSNFLTLEDNETAALDWDAVPSLELPGAGSAGNIMQVQPSGAGLNQVDKMRFEIGGQTIMYALNYSPLALLIDTEKIALFIKNDLPNYLDKASNTLDLHPLKEELKRSSGVQDGALAIFFEELGRQHLPWKLKLPEVQLEVVQGSIILEEDDDGFSPKVHEHSSSWFEDKANISRDNIPKRTTTPEFIPIDLDFDDEEFGIIPSKRGQSLSLDAPGPQPIGLEGSLEPLGNTNFTPNTTKTLGAVSAVPVDQLIQSSQSTHPPGQIHLNPTAHAPAMTKTLNAAVQTVPVEDLVHPDFSRSATNQQASIHTVPVDQLVQPHSPASHMAVVQGTPIDDYAQDDFGFEVHMEEAQFLRMEAPTSIEFSIEDFDEEDFSPIKSKKSPAKMSNKQSQLDGVFATFSPKEFKETQRKNAVVHPTLLSDTSDTDGKGALSSKPTAPNPMDLIQDATSTLVGAFVSSPLSLWINPNGFRSFLSEYIPQNIVNQQLNLEPLWKKLVRTPGMQEEILEEYLREVARQRLPWPVAPFHFLENREAQRQRANGPHAAGRPSPAHGNSAFIHEDFDNPSGPDSDDIIIDLAPDVLAQLESVLGPIQGEGASKEIRSPIGPPVHLEPISNDNLAASKKRRRTTAPQPPPKKKSGMSGSVWAIFIIVWILIAGVAFYFLK